MGFMAISHRRPKQGCVSADSWRAPRRAYNRETDVFLVAVVMVVGTGGVRAAVRRAANGDRRILRRPADRPAQRSTREWPITIVDVLTGNETAYWHRVVTWAESVIRTLDGDAAS